MPPHTIPWVLVANFVTAGVLVLVALRSEWRGWRLGVAISAIPITLGLTNVIEGTIFLINVGIDWSRIIAHTVIVYEFCVPVWILLFAKSPEKLQSESGVYAVATLAKEHWPIQSGMIKITLIVNGPNAIASRLIAEVGLPGRETTPSR
jgi:hypothetical protein